VLNIVKVGSYFSNLHPIDIQSNLINAYLKVGVEGVKMTDNYYVFTKC